MSVRETDTRKENRLYCGNRVSGIFSWWNSTWPNMPITRYLDGRSFDDAALQLMGEAFGKAQQLLHDRGQPSVVRELIANAIIQIFSAGERDVDEIARQSLKALGIGLDNVA